MNTIARLNDEDRKFIFLKTSEATGKSVAIVEKDYWISYLLDYLFAKSSFNDMLVFKGGTSLSKGFNLINRMSEDIDLILNWKRLGEEYNLDLLEKDDTLSRNQLNKKKKEILKKTNEFLINDFAPELSKGIERDLGYKIGVSCVDENGGVVIYVDYPKIIHDTYLLDVVKLEIGPLAALTPTIIVDISPYCLDVFPDLCENKAVKVKTVIPERSFWEKATILHREALRPSEKLMPRRYFRHYYDLYMLQKSQYKETAIKDIALLQSVIRFKERFYRETWMNYETILTKGIRLIPDRYRFEELRKDCYDMREMIQEPFSFDDVINCLTRLEKEINEMILKKH